MAYRFTMGLFSRRKKSDDSKPSASQAKKETIDHLREFVETRKGVEALIEPATSVTQTTILLIATDGEWTRRKVPDAETGWKIAKELDIPCYDVNFVGYPQRMRDWNALSRQRATEID